MPCGLFDSLVPFLPPLLARRQLKVEKEERCAMMEADRAVNLLEHQKEIHARPARQWIVSQQRKVRIAMVTIVLLIAATLNASLYPGFGA